jgi:large subunit ribosomal protein L6
MSRKGKLPIALPKGVEVKIQENTIHVKGPKGSLSHEIAPGVFVKQDDGALHVSVEGDSKRARAFHGLYRAIVNNMVVGTSTGFEKKLEMVGVGYRAAVQGSLLDLQVGFSHPTQLPIPTGVQVKVDKNTLIVITGIDKQVVGEFAAKVRAKRPPEPYQGKGIRYVDEYVRRKAGKAAKSAKK